MMSSKNVLDILRPHTAQFKRMKVQRLAFFGSIARGDSHPGSDFDFLVEYSVPTTFDLFFDLKHLLEDLLGGPVDLVTFKSLKPALKPLVEKDLINIA